MFSPQKHKQSQNFFLLIFLVSCGLVSFQIFLIQLFSITQWSSFAAMIISIALLGYGAAGSFLTVFKKKLMVRINAVIKLSLITCGILIIGSVRLSRMEAFAFDSFELFAQKTQVIRMILTYLLFILPFFTGSIAIGLIYTKYTNQISKYYFFDLTGAALGGLLLLIMLRYLSLNYMLAVISVFFVLASLLINTDSGKVFKWTLYGVYSLVLISNLFLPIKLNFSQFKGISYALDLPDSKITWEQQSIYGFTQVVQSPSSRYAPGLSLNYTGNIPACNTIFNNGNTIGVFFNDALDSTQRFLEESTIYLPFAFKEYENVLLLQAEKGIQIQLVNTISNSHSTCVISNKNIANLLNKKKPQLNIIQKSSRHFLQNNKSSFDLIILPTLGSFGGGDGIDAFREKPLLTSESVQIIKKHLSADGVIALSVWLDNPLRYPYRSLSLLQSIEQENAKMHFVAVKNWGLITICYKINPFTENEVNSIESFTNTHSFDFLLHPKKNLIFDLSDNPDSSLIANYNTIIMQQESQYESSFKIIVPTDNHPYFSQFLKFKDLGAVFQNKRQINPFIEIDYFVHLFSFLQVIVFAILLIILPLFTIRFSKKVRLWTAFYFCSIGLGYMFLEIVLIKSLSSYFGHQVYAATIVITILLISSGLGSIVSNTIISRKKIILILNLSVLILTIIYAIVFPGVIGFSLGYSYLLKLIVIIILIFCPGFIMGMLFPAGLKLLSSINKSNVPWAWGINGTSSVIATSLASIIIIETGFVFLFVLTGIMYGLAALSTLSFLKPH